MSFWQPSFSSSYRSDPGPIRRTNKAKKLTKIAPLRARCEKCGRFVKKDEACNRCDRIAEKNSSFADYYCDDGWLN